MFSWGRCGVPTPDVSGGRRRLLVCQGSGCQAAGARVAWQRRGRRSESHDTVVVPTACLAMCRAAPIVVLYPEGSWLGRARGRRVAVIWAAVESGAPARAPGFLYRRPEPEAPDGR